MRDPGQLWNDCHNGKIEEGRWEYQRKLVIGDVEYLDEDLLDVKFERGLMDRTISFGNSISATLKASILPHTRQIVNRNSPVIYYVRVIDLNDNVSPWVKFGEFYIDKAKNEFNRWNIECYDAMYKLEVNFPKGEYSSSEAVNIIARRMGVQIDSRTNMNVSFTIKNAQEYSMREVLGYIGSMNIGNWHITEEGKLKLTKLSIGKHVQSVLSSNSMNITGSDTMKFNKVTVKYSSNVDDKYEAGNGDNEFEIFNPFANQGMADRLLSFFSNYTFFPGIIDSTEVNPAIELGDTIEIENNGVLFDINLINVSFSDRLYADIETPFDTDKLQDTFHFDAVGKDYDDVIQDHEDRINLLEQLMGLSGCVNINKGMLNEKNEAPSAAVSHITSDECCVIIGGNIESCKLFDKPVSFRKMSVKGGSDMKDLSSLVHGNIDLRELDISDMTSKPDKINKITGFLNISTLNISGSTFDNCSDMVSAFESYNGYNVNIDGLLNPKVEFDASSMFSGSVDVDTSKIDLSNAYNLRALFYNASFKNNEVFLKRDSKVKLRDIGSMFSGKGTIDKISYSGKLEWSDEIRAVDLQHLFFRRTIGDFESLSDFLTNFLNLKNQRCLGADEMFTNVKQLRSGSTFKIPDFFYRSEDSGFPYSLSGIEIDTVDISDIPFTLRRSSGSLDILENAKVKTLIIRDNYPDDENRPELVQTKSQIIRGAKNNVPGISVITESEYYRKNKEV